MHIFRLAVVAALLSLSAPGVTSAQFSSGFGGSRGFSATPRRKHISPRRNSAQLVEDARRKKRTDAARRDMMKRRFEHSRKRKRKRRNTEKPKKDTSAENLVYSPKKNSVHGYEVLYRETRKQKTTLVGGVVLLRHVKTTGGSKDEPTQAKLTFEVADNLRTLQSASAIYNKGLPTKAKKMDKTTKIDARGKKLPVTGTKKYMGDYVSWVLPHVHEHVNNENNNGYRIIYYGAENYTEDYEGSRGKVTVNAISIGSGRASFEETRSLSLKRQDENVMDGEGKYVFDMRSGMLEWRELKVSYKNADVTTTASVSVKKIPHKRLIQMLQSQLSSAK